jgi:hypothetical protein
MTSAVDTALSVRLWNKPVNFTLSNQQVASRMTVQSSALAFTNSAFQDITNLNTADIGITLTNDINTADIGITLTILTLLT